MGAWYTFGALLGAGVGLGVIAAGLLGVSTRGLVAAVLVAAAASVAFAIAFDWIYVAAAVVGAVVGAVCGSIVVRGALRRGGTRIALAVYIAAVGIVLMLLAAIPLVGYAEAVGLPLLAVRMRAREPERHAGLRTLAK